MNTPDNGPDTGPADEKLAALLGAADRNVPPPDREFLERLRKQSQQEFVAATLLSTPFPLWKRIMLRSSFRWVAASAALVLVLGIVVARWLTSTPVEIPVPLPVNRFVVEEKLIDDGRIGKVTDAQGIVSIKPVLHERWSPVQSRLVLKPGDLLQTDARGANAVALKLLKSGQVIVGPHSTVELVQANEIHLMAGEIEISAAVNAPIELQGPDKQKMTISDKQLIRVEKEKLVRVDKEPVWLQGFKGTTANESLGSLIATVDGRNVPLTVGYHHVSVDIRDQIARTVIEESFVNRTNAVLEGVFYFPLPQDASISGFGMWIGDQLVEADIVEKQRAREIYETILREKRDPGLLEWSGGNIFKARVYPIPGHGEKRIKISYTQVLPLQGNRYRYSYALQSEMLKQHPLRDLTIDLKVNSALALKNVTSPTHTARIAKTEHSGHVEFSAQEFVPTRDFEAVIELENRQSDVVLIPHRRGDDGYFMVQLTPPGESGDWERPLIPNGDPLRLLLLADTSASMDQAQRSTRNAILTSILSSLTPKDFVNVAACDVNCDWVFEKPVPATPANLAAIREALVKRVSLGWTDLDKAFASTLTMTDPSTHVVYLGDGIVTTGDADPVAFAKRLHQLYEGKTGTFHAVATGSSYEPGVLKAIASLGGGSLRRVSGDQGPQAIALSLLNEIATPALRNLKVEFKGLRTARVYPEELPNVAPGTQQILLGRYLPEGTDQAGEIVVSGMLGNKPVRFTSKVALRDAEAGNSFIPRLWARMHLDKLLEQGTSEIVKQDIISLSEEFGIITPYTSFLVLESDADRERFAVKRRFQMRDGERFFAEGRENATFELKQKQMKHAGDYRTALRRRAIEQLAGLGRNSRTLEAIIRGSSRYHRLGSPLSVTDSSDAISEVADLLEPLGDKDSKAIDEFVIEGRFSESAGSYAPAGDWNEPFPSDAKADFLEPKLKARKRESGFEETPGEPREDLATGLPPMSPHFDPIGVDYDLFFRDAEGFGVHLPPLARPEFGETLGRVRRRSPSLQWLGSLFPALSPPASQPREPKSTWPAPALALSRSLLRGEKLAQQKGGIVLTRQLDTFNREGELAWRNKALELVSPTAWLTRSWLEGGQVTVSWCDSQERGTYDTAFLLGRVRGSFALDPEGSRPARERISFPDRYETPCTAELRESLQERSPGLNEVR
jgi:hypothetical protein